MAPSSDDNSTTSSPWAVFFPHQNDTSALRAITVPHWVDSPNVRGTFDILQSCVLTLVACIYTALHLNVPEKNASHKIIWSKTQWVALTLFAPEIVLYMAADQLQQAWALRRKLRNLQRQSDTVDKDFNFDLKYAFFVVMGGVHIDVEDILSLPDLDEDAHHYFANMPSPRSVCITPQGLLILAEKGHWLYISRKRIDDKSKADYIQKALVLTQILWMVTQCITRYVKDLPLTLLEIHTVIHVVCAVFLYACWFQKPLNVQEPEVLNPSQFLGHAARMVQQQYYSSWVHELALLPPWSPEQPIAPPSVASDQAPMLWYNPEHLPVMRQGDVMLSGLALYRSSRELEVTAPFLRRWDAIFSAFPYQDREVLARDAYSKFKAPQIDEEEGRTSDKVLYLWFLREFDKPSHKRGLSFSHGVRNLESHFGFTIGGLSVLLPACYGGVHLATWKRTFPSHFESVFWKVCCVYIICVTPAVYIVTMVCLGLLALLDSRFIADYPDDKRDGLLDMAFAGLVGLNIPVVAMYVVARVYIVLESFLSLRYVPLGVFLSPPWLQMFPHL